MAGHGVAQANYGQMFSITTMKVLHGGNYNVTLQRQLERLPAVVRVFSTDR
jgi:hypothetical protein